jgi:uncharacterized membrane protein YbhN (UPF0104 family)
MGIIKISMAILFAVALGWLVWWDISHPDIYFILAFFVAQIPLFINLILVSYRSRLLSNNKISFKAALKGYSMATISALFLPAKLGDLGKPSYFKAICHFPLAKGFVIVLEERIWDIIILAILAITIFFYIGDITNNNSLINTSILLFMAAIFGIAVLIFLPKYSKRIPFFAKFEKKYAVFSKKSPRKIFSIFMISLLAWIMSLLILFFAYKYSGLPDIEFDQILLLFVLSTLGLVVTITPGGIGTYEGIIFALLVNNNIDWESALAFAIFFRVCCLITPGFISVFALMNDGKILITRNKKNINE